MAEEVRTGARFRHLSGAAVGLVLSPLVLIGFSYSAEMTRQPDQMLRLDMVATVGAAVVTAVVVGFVFASRLSPLASVVMSAPLLAVGVVYLLPVGALLVTLPRWLPGLPALGHTGMALVLGIVGMVPAMIPSRWKAWPAAGRRRPTAPPSGLLSVRPVKEPGQPSRVDVPVVDLRDVSFGQWEKPFIPGFSAADSATESPVSPYEGDEKPPPTTT